MKTLFRILVALLIMVGFAGCSPQLAQPSNPTALSTPTSTASPLTSKTAPATLTSSATPVPTEAASTRITPQNADEVYKIKQLGQGMVDGAPFYSKDGELLVIPTTRGVDLYEARTLRKLTAIAPSPEEGVTRVQASPHLVVLSADRRYVAASLRAAAFSLLFSSR